MKKSIILSSIIAATFATAVQAAPDFNTITFKGMVKETTCTVTSTNGGGDFTVNMPIYAPSQFQVTAGKIASSKATFTITATGNSCNTAKLYISAANADAGVINAVRDGGTELLPIALQTAAGADVVFGDLNGVAATTSTGTGASASSDFVFNAYYNGVGASGTAPVTGTYTATATYIITHQ